MGYTQREVARLLGYRSATHISAYERGKRLPSLETAIKLEVVLCAPVAFLFPDIRRRALGCGWSGRRSNPAATSHPKLSNDKA